MINIKTYSLVNLRTISNRGYDGHYMYMASNQIGAWFEGGDKALVTFFLPWSEIAALEATDTTKFIKPHSEFNGETRFATDEEEQLCTSLWQAGRCLIEECNFFTGYDSQYCSNHQHLSGPQYMQCGKPGCTNDMLRNNKRQAVSFYCEEHKKSKEQPCKPQ